MWTKILLVSFSTELCGQLDLGDRGDLLNGLGREALSHFSFYQQYIERYLYLLGRLFIVFSRATLLSFFQPFFSSSLSWREVNRYLLGGHPHPNSPMVELSDYLVSKQFGLCCYFAYTYCIMYTQWLCKIYIFCPCVSYMYVAMVVCSSPEIFCF